MKFSKKNRSIKNKKNKNISKNNINKYKYRKNRTRKNIIKKGGAKKDEQLDVKETLKEIGKVPFGRLERQINDQIEFLKKITNNCAASCKTESCFYNNKDNCEKLDELIKTKSDLDIGEYCAEKFQNMSCTKFGKLYEKIKFFLKYIDTVNTNCHNLMSEYEKGSQFKENEKLFM